MGSFILSHPVYSDNSVCVLQHTLEFKKNEDEKVNVGVNARENYVTYHIQDGDTEVSVIQDFYRVGKANVFTPYICTDKLDIIHTLACLDTNFNNLSSLIT